MSVIFMDSFQHYATADIGKKWTSVTSGVTIDIGTGRRAGNSMKFTSGTALTLVFGAAYSGLIIGAAFKIGTSTDEMRLFYLAEGATKQASLYVAPDGVLKAYRGDPTTLLGESAPGAVPINTWCFIEASFVVDNVAGAVVVKVNGTTVLTISGVDTQTSANAYATTLVFGQNSFGGTLYLNDLYVIDPGTAPNTTFLGDVRVDAYYPTADGASSQWTPTPSGAHYANVDETAPNGTDYIEADVTGYIDLFAAQDLAVVPGAFYAVQLCAAALKTDAGSRKLKGVVRLGGVNYKSGAKDVSETQKFVLQQFNADPSTAVAWTKTNFDAAEFGVELV